jgi:YidC/Oxa1 family membrane protein insertase
MMDFFRTILYIPLLNLLIGIYNVIPWTDLGIAIIILTVLIKIVLYPLNRKAIVSQKALQDLQPKLEAIKQAHKDDKQAQAKATMELYRQEKINPASSCLPLLIQLPFLIAVYQVFNTGISNGSLEYLYSFVSNPGSLQVIAFGFLDLTERSVVLALLAGAAQFWQSKMLFTKRPPIQTKGAQDENLTAIMNKQMLYVMPVFTVIIGLSFPAGLTLYWFMSTLLTALQQLIVFRPKKNQSVNPV